MNDIARGIDIEIRRAVAVAYRKVRQTGQLDHPAFLAARDVYVRMTGDEAGAGKAVPRIVSWAASEHTAWFWKGVGGQSHGATPTSSGRV